jgi:dihydrofolate synthase / folylpolyglutamate synthase
MWEIPQMKINAFKTHRINPGEDLYTILDKYLGPVTEESIIAVTSKVISICQNRIVSPEAAQNKYALVKQEADAYLNENLSSYNAHLTIMNDILIPSAGIDESNGNGMFILYPLNIQHTAQEIWEYLRDRHNVKKLGIIITDSHTMPLRKGVTGICLGWCGFEPLYNYIGNPDIYNNPLRVTQINILDALAASAVFMMGEGSEQTPFAIIQDVPRIQFLMRSPSPEEEASIHIPLEDDIYAPLLRSVNWIWNKKS